MKRRQQILSVSLGLFIACAVTVTADTLRNIPVEDPVYRFLEYARAAGRLDFLPRVRPYSQADVLALLDDVLELEQGADDGWVSGRAMEHRARLARPNRTVATALFGEESTVTLGAAVTLETDVALARPSDTIPTLSVPVSLGIDIGDSVHISLDAVAEFSYRAWSVLPYGRYDTQPLADYYVYTYWFDTGTGSFNHSGRHDPGRPSLQIASDTINQFSLGLEYLTVHAGRDALDWGPSPVANLLLSASAKPYDYLGFTMPLGNAGTFAWITGILHDFAWEPGGTDERLINVHRLEYQVTDWLYLALYESVIYDFAFELAYLNPLSFYYVTEVTRGSEDNKLGGMDFIVNLPPVEVYASVFADDWDAGRLLALNASHNEWAAVLGARAAGVLVPGLTLNLELVYLSHWMYTHFTWVDSFNVGKSYQHYGMPLGHFLGPNSWMAHLAGSYEFPGGSRVDTRFRVIRDGRGDINTPPNWSDESSLHGVTDYRDITYSFLDRGKPGFVIDTTLDWSISGFHEFVDTGLAVGAEYVVQYSFSQATEDMSRVPDSDRLEHFLSVEATWLPGSLVRR